MSLAPLGGLIPQKSLPVFYSCNTSRIYHISEVRMDQTPDSNQAFPNVKEQFLFDYSTLEFKPLIKCQKSLIFFKLRDGFGLCKY